MATSTGRLLTEARAELARGPAVLEALTAGLDAAAWRTRPVAGEWSPIEIVCHLRDEEQDDFGARLRVILDGGERFVPIDPPRWVEERRYREADPAGALRDFASRRHASLALLAAATAPRLEGAVEQPRLGRMSGADLVAAWVAHDRLHLAQMASTLTRLWADRWAPLRVEYAGPIPYPGAAPPPA